MILEWVGNEVRGLELGNINVGNVASVPFLLVLLASESPSVDTLSESKIMSEHCAVVQCRIIMSVSNRDDLKKYSIRFAVEEV